MIELPSISDPVYSEDLWREECALHQKIGQVAFSCFALIGGVVALAGMSRKKTRVVSLPSARAPLEVFVPAPIEPAPQLAPPIQMPPLPNNPYESLRWRDEDKMQIREMMTTLGRYGKGEIGFFVFMGSAPKFWQYEAELDSPEKGGSPLHPFKFLETIFGDPALKAYMPFILKTPLLRSNYLKGVKKGFNREADGNHLEPYIDSFSQKVGVSPDVLRPLIRDREWEALVDLLTRNDAAHEEQRFPV